MQNELPRSFNDFHTNHLLVPKSSMDWFAIATISLTSGLTIGVATANLACGILSIWLTFTGLIFGGYACIRIYHKTPIAKLPWNCAWTWMFLLLTVTWLPCWVVSFWRIKLRAKHNTN